MDEREFEERLRRRMHARFDTGSVSPAVRDEVSLALRRDPRRAWPNPWRWAGLAAAALLIVTTVGLVGRYVTMPAAQVQATETATPTSKPLVGPTATPSNFPTIWPSTPPTATVPPVSTATWKGLTVQKLASAPVAVSTIIPWAGGYVAVAQNEASLPETVWSSTDGRSWTQLPATTFGLDNTSTFVSAGSSCRDGVIVATDGQTGGPKFWHSADGVTWVYPTVPATPTNLAGNSSGAISTSSAGLEFTSDCATWQPVTLPGPADAHLASVAAFGSGFVAAGWSGSIDGGSTVRPLAWWSADGLHWTQATVPSSPGFALTNVYAAGGGLLGSTTNIGVTPGTDNLMTSADGRTWKAQPGTLDPLGVQTTGEGIGQHNGAFSGDGARLAAFGNPTFEGTVPNQVWISTDGTHWSQLTVAGPGAAAPMDPGRRTCAFLLRDGIFFSGPDGSWFGEATT